MNIKYILNPFIVCLVLILSACEPIVDEAELVNNSTVENVEIVATQTTAGGNEITLEMKTPGITGYWNYYFGKALTDKVTFAFPLTGTFNFTFKGTLGAEFFEKSISVTIDVLDSPVAPEWAALLGDDAIAGKNWVYNKVPAAWWYMAPIDDPSAWSTVWWDANSCCAPGDADGKMHFFFDSVEGIKYDYYADVNGEPVHTSFDLKPASGDYGTLRITGGENILGAYNDRGTSSSEYTVISLTEDEMVLYCAKTDAGDSGWVYIFKPE